jgi:pSer/pThr/pTyr-binding forkhead associated (FHA) protein
MAGNPKLTVLFEKLRGKTFELDRPEMTAGRKDPMDICIKDPSLSGHHCTFIRTATGSYIIRDNDSTNGTRVNNVPVTEQELKNSDIIQLGGVEVLYDCGLDADGTTGVSSFGRTHTINLDSLESNLSTVKDLGNYSPFAKVEGKKQARTNKIMLIGLGVLGLGLLVMLAIIGWRLFASAE